VASALRHPAPRPRRRPLVRPAVVLGALALAAGPAAAAPLELGARLSATVNGVLQVATPAPRAAAPAASVPVSPTALGVRLQLPIADVQLSTDPVGSGPLLAVGGDVAVGEVASVSLGAQADVDLVPPPSSGAPPVGDGAPPAADAPAAPAPPAAAPPVPVRRPAQDPAGSAPAAPARPGAGAAPDASAAPPASASAPRRSSAGRLAASASTPRPAPAASPRAVDRVVEVAIAVVRSPWLIAGVILAALAYVLGQRMLDRGSKKLSHPGRPGAPDDELLEF
jgi:hypothetical protein